MADPVVQKLVKGALVPCSLEEFDALAISVEIVICAAINVSGVIIRGQRHHNCLAVMRDWPTLPSAPIVQGFITSRNRFVDRQEGQRLQLAAGIPSHDPGGYRGDALFSEDLY